ncbi:N-terminal binuclear Zn cluster-containing/DNA binding domain-containing protein [Stachybotrys elegans]|uniref:N-terminal binuclear Zn cluster-containing/DNA binding domain-containing protein n=1 Tax=Stachybotrys elegans TaxID=80388 RepID=A0A8K0T1T4_9HYPO|nr:N-terminal binuclear Zn cluster-containing/DNA binding domain-containing protein [Stachybotrys elegans]
MQNTNSPLSTTQNLSPPSSSSPSSEAPGSSAASRAGDNTESPTSLTSASTVNEVRREPTVPAACLGCRNKHLKCDGRSPCSRCVASNTECHYVASRRGYKGPRRAPVSNPYKRLASSPPEVDTDGHGILSAGTPVSAESLIPYQSGYPPLAPNHGPPFNGAPAFGTARLYTGYVPAGHDMTIASPASMSSTSSLGALGRTLSLAERCLESFYRNFHGAHPFVLPKDAFLQVAREGIVEPLLATMRWVGSLHLPVASSRPGLLEEAERRVNDPDIPQDGFLLQAMLVLLIALDGSGNQEKARGILGKAETLAVQIAINTRPFAALHGRGWPVLEESWRRTWWELFVADGMIAGVHRATNFSLFDVPADADLPCEEHEFLSCNIPQPMTLDEMENRDFLGDEREFSSFAYRIMCARNLGKFMRVPQILSPEDENMARIEALLTNWRLHLPPSKKIAMHKDGKLDEMMFQAHMMTNAMSILLHQPHSQLDSAPAQKINSCAEHRPVRSGDLWNDHTRHTMASADEISKMITHRVPLLSHTHFFACVITMSSIVHLSKWALHFMQHDDDDLRQQIRLNIGALNELSSVWCCAGRARDQVKGVAQEIYRAKKQLQSDPEYWVGFTQQEMVQSIATDNSIINDLEQLPNLGPTLGSPANMPVNLG